MTTRRKGLAAALLAAMVCAVSVSAQQRDVRSAQTGTGEIAGVVVNAGSPTETIRRAVVTISGGDLPNPRSVITDDAGRFAFSRLAAGTFAITARKAAYLPAEFGSTRPGRPGSKIALAAGEKRAVTLTMFRGAVIGGELRDAQGLPLAGVHVAALDAGAAQGPAAIPAPETAVTDDRGAFRIYGLMPGEYVLAATPRPGGSGEIGGRTAAEIDAILAALTQRQNRPATSPATTPPAPLPVAASIGYAPVYFPGTPYFADAERVRIGAGEEREAINFQVDRVPVATIEGVVGGDVANPAAAQLAIIPDTPRVSGSFPGVSITSQPPNDRGEFKYGNLPPGRYRIIARARRDQAAAETVLPAGVTITGGGAGGGVPPPGATSSSAGDMVYGVVDVDVSGQDVRGVTIQMRLGGTLSGKLVFDSGGAPIPDELTGFRVGTYLLDGSWVSSSGSTRVGNALGSNPPVNVNDDGTFAITGIGPAMYFVNCTVPTDLSSVWKLRSVMANGRDLLDTLVEGPAVQLTAVSVVLSDKKTELTGTLQSASGQAISDYHIVVFSTDRTLWRRGARRSLSTRPATDGRFVFSDLPSGEYYIAALTDIESRDWQLPAFLEQIVPAAVKLTVPEGQVTTQDLRIR